MVLQSALTAAPDTATVRENVALAAKAVALNEALILGALRQHEMTEAAEALNEQLRTEIVERNLAEAEVRKLNAELERRVMERTSELSTANGLLMLEISERKSAEVELLRALTVADDANQAKSAFLARMSHEIRTPMNGILGMTHLLKQTTLTLKQGDYASKISCSAENLMHVINDILDFSKIEAGKMELENAAFNLEELLARILSSLSVQSQKKSLELKVSIAPETPMRLVGDSLRLGQVLTNLVGNAIKFTEAGEVEITVLAIERDETYASLEFKVRDTGMGIGAGEIGRLFEPFSQSDTSTSRRFGGTGLGLAIAQRFVQLMGGEITVVSQLNSGSTFGFTVRFGLDLDSKRNKRQMPVETAHRQALIVDADGPRSLQLSRLLTELSFDTVCVASSADAVRELSRLDQSGLQRYHLVLIDCAHEGMMCADGAKKIRHDCAGVPLPHFILVASAELSDMHLQLEKLGFDSAVLQPVTRSALFDATQRALTKGSDSEVAIPAAISEQLSSGPRILLVDDEELNRQVATEILQMEGYQVWEADGGEHALALMNSASCEPCFAAILMDIQMPVMDGFATTRLIRANSRFDNIPIIAMTGDAVIGVKEKCLAAGMNDFLTKPIKMSEFYATLKTWIASPPPAGTA